MSLITNARLFIKINNAIAGSQVQHRKMVETKDEILKYNAQFIMRVYYVYIVVEMTLNMAKQLAVSGRSC